MHFKPSEDKSEKHTLREPVIFSFMVSKFFEWLNHQKCKKNISFCFSPFEQYFYSTAISLVSPGNLDLRTGTNGARLVEVTFR